MTAIEAHIAPYAPINEATPDLFQQLGNVKYSFALSPRESHGACNGYLTFHTHLAERGIIMEAQVDREKYETARSGYKVGGALVSLAGLSSPGYKGAKAAKEQIMATDWKRAEEVENRVTTFLYSDVERLKVKTGWFKLVPTVEFYVKDGSTLPYLVSYLPGRTPDVFVVNLLEVAEAFVEKFNLLKAART